jgi:hypothetical protein
VDLAQQPEMVYQVFGAVYGALGLLLGLYQMGGYRRPNTWLNLLHRPMAPSRIALGLVGAGALLLAIGVLLPLLAIAAWQHGMTPRVVDLRHLGLIGSAWLIAVCAYLAGCFAMLADKRISYCSGVFLLLLVASKATGSVRSRCNRSCSPGCWRWCWWHSSPTSRRRRRTSRARVRGCAAARWRCGLARCWWASAWKFAVDRARARIPNNDRVPTGGRLKELEKSRRQGL